MKSGYHVVYARDYTEGIADARTYGFNFAQFELGVPSFYLDGLSDTQLKEIRDYVESSGVEITFHAPGDNVSLYADYPCVRRGNLEQFERILEKANMLKARHMTVHAGEFSSFKQSGGAGDVFAGTFAAYYEDVLYENLKEVLRYAGDVLVCLENYHLNGVGMRAAQRLLDEGQSLYLTLDIPKIYTSSAAAQINEAQLAFYHKNRHAIRELHIHDCSEAHGSHQTVGTGSIDFSLFLPFCGPEVYLNFEVRPVEEAAKSRLAWEAIILEDSR